MNFNEIDFLWAMRAIGIDVHVSTVYEGDRARDKFRVVLPGSRYELFHVGRSFPECVAWLSTCTRTLVSYLVAARGTCDLDTANKITHDLVDVFSAYAETIAWQNFCPRTGVLL